jgi:hypothetical protein
MTADGLRGSPSLGSPASSYISRTLGHPREQFVERRPVSIPSIHGFSGLAHDVRLPRCLLLSTFWEQVLGYDDVAGDPNEPGHKECLIIGSDAEPSLLFVEVPEGKQVKNRVHLDDQLCEIGETGLCG